MAVGVRDPVPVPDGGWGWLVVLASFVVQALTVGITYTFGILFVDLMDYFKASEADTAWIGSIQPALFYFTGVFGGPLIKRFGWRKVTIFGAIIACVGFSSSALATNIYILYFTYGGLTGIGMGCMYLTSMIVIQHYFDKRRAMATGLAVSGSGVGTLVFGILTQALLDRLGWRYTLLIQGGIILLGIVCGALYRPLTREDDPGVIPAEKDALNEDTALLIKPKTSDYGSRNGLVVEADDVMIYTGTGSRCCSSCCCCSCACASTCCESPCGETLRETFDFSIFKDVQFTLFVLALMMFNFGYHVPYTYTPERASKALGVETTEASLLISIMGISNTGSRLVFGWIADRSPNVRFYMGGLTLLCGGIISILIFLFKSYTTLIVYSVLFGTFSGCWVSLFPVILVDLLGVGLVERSVGLAMSSGSIVFLIASPMAGFIIDKTGSFDVPFMVVGAAQTLGSIIYFSIRCTRRRRDPEQESGLLRDRTRRFSESFH